MNTILHDSKLIDTSGFFKTAFIGMMFDIKYRLELPVYMLNGGDQRYWTANNVGKATRNIVAPGDLDELVVDAKNFVNETPRVIVEIGQPNIHTQALTQGYTPIKLVPLIDNTPTAIYATMRRVPIQYNVTLTGFASSMTSCFNLYEHLLTKIFSENSYSFMWLGVIHAGVYNIQINSQDLNNGTIAHDTANKDAKIVVQVQLFLQYPSIDAGSAIISGTDIIKEPEHNIDIDFNADIQTDSVNDLVAIDSASAHYVAKMSKNSGPEFQFAAAVNKKFDCQSYAADTPSASISSSTTCSYNGCALNRH